MLMENTPDADFEAVFYDGKERDKFLKLQCTLCTFD